MNASRSHHRMQARIAAMEAEGLRRAADQKYRQGEHRAAIALYRRAKQFDRQCDEHCANAARS